MTSHPIQLFTVCMTNKKKRNFGFYPFRTVNTILTSKTSWSSSPTNTELKRTPAIGVVKANTPSWLALWLRIKKTQVIKHNPATTIP